MASSPLQTLQNPTNYCGFSPPVIFGSHLCTILAPLEGLPCLQIALQSAESQSKPKAGNVNKQDACVTGLRCLSICSKVTPRLKKS
ncbi:hypothetical protein CDAR_314361 [Caerostris darwini]|uniref:Uncharacterized protein n=1 Tax=Caerostris darwini TaxID=1538125 RepID=A0AAV4TVY8_9ARAC|nr:hypothetical protein CDAR_314361 [Caerostris darwini]